MSDHIPFLVKSCQWLRGRTEALLKLSQGLIRPPHQPAAHTLPCSLFQPHSLLTRSCLRNPTHAAPSTWMLFPPLCWNHPQLQPQSLRSSVKLSLTFRWAPTPRIYGFVARALAVGLRDWVTSVCGVVSMHLLLPGDQARVTQRLVYRMKDSPS